MTDFAFSISSTEPLFFRDGKPASAGESVFSTGRFPPAPSVLYGALRGAYFSQHPETFETRNTENDPTRSLVLTTYQLATNDSPLFPLPADLVRTRHQSTLFPLQLRAVGETFISNRQRAYYLTLDRTLKADESSLAYLTQPGFERYINGELPTTYTDLRAYMTHSARMGIARQHGVVREGALFRFDRTQLEGQTGRLSFFLAGSGLDCAKTGRIELGSDGPPAFYQSTEPIGLPIPNIQVGAVVKLMLMTPGLFTAGWLPKVLTKPGIEVLAASVGKPYGIGGFDMKTNTPKPMYRAVPAGAVYVLRPTTDEGAATLTAHHARSWSDYLPEQGFGIGYLAKPLTGQQLPVTTPL